MDEIIQFLDTTSMAQPKILLVEDCPFDTQLTKKIIEKHFSYSIIEHAETKNRACAVLLRTKFDLILLDLNLPDSVSLQDVEDIKRISKDTPIIVVTGTPTQEIAEQIKQFGASGIIGKDAIVNQDLPTVVHMAIDNIAAA